MTTPPPVYLVAGVGSGLGTAVVSLLLASGATVVGMARTPEALAEIGSEAARRGWIFHAEVADLRVAADIDGVVGRTVERHGRIDGAALTVGRWVPGATRLEEMSEGEWHDALRDNLLPVFRIGHALFPVLLRQGRGSVVLVSATRHVRRAASASYGIAKAGLLELTEKLAGEYRPRGIRVNAVLPGNMGRVVGFDPPAAGTTRLRTDEPSAPWEVARAIRFLLSEESAWVTGALLTVDGGLSTEGAEAPS